MTDQMKQARDEKARTYAYNNAIYIDKAMLNKKGYQYLEEKPAKDFKEGTDWYRNNVWHPASEEPKDKAQCLVIAKRKSKDIVTYSNQFFYKGHVVADPCKLYALSDIIMWADMEDLLPDTEEHGDKTCMYAKDEFSSDDRVILCKDCKEECRFNHK